MAFQDVDDFEAVRKVAEENNIAFVGEAAEVGADFRTRPAQGAGQGRELGALAPQIVCEPLTNRTVFAHFRDVSGDLDQIGKRRIEKDEAAQLIPGFRQFCIERIQGAGYIFIGVMTAGSDRGVYGVA